MTREQIVAAEAERANMNVHCDGRVSIATCYQYDMRQWLFAQAKIYRRIADGPYAAGQEYIRTGLSRRARLCEYLANCVADDMSLTDWKNGEKWMTDLDADDDATDLYVDTYSPPVQTAIHPNDTDDTPQ